MDSKKLEKMQSHGETTGKNKQIHGSTFLGKVLSIFPLNKRVESTTEHDWEIYTANRLAAEKKFPGPKEKKPRFPSGEEDSDDQDDEGEDDAWRFGDDDKIFVLKLIRRNMNKLEDEMCLEKLVLQQGFRLIACDAVFENEDNPRTVTALTRIYSPLLPIYVDVHFQYRYHPHHDAIEWFYSLGFKVHKHPRTNDYNPPELKKFEDGRFDGAYTSNGWRPIAYGFYDGGGEDCRKWRKIECADFQLTGEGVREAYEALWGQLKEVPNDDEEDEDVEADIWTRRKTMVDTVRVLLAAVGIGYDIAVDDEEEDQPSCAFKLEGLSDRWFARGVRAACGFQLENDPDDAIRGQKEGQDEAREPNYDSECVSEEWAVSDEYSGDSDF